MEKAVAKSKFPPRFPCLDTTYTRNQATTAEARALTLSSVEKKNKEGQSFKAY